MLRLYRYYYYKIHLWMEFVKERYPKDAVIYGISMPVMFYYLGIVCLFSYTFRLNPEDYKIILVIIIVLIPTFNFWYFHKKIGHANILKEFKSIATRKKKISSMLSFLFTVLSFPFPWLCLWIATR